MPITAFQQLVDFREGIEESSASRIWSHIQGRGSFGMISAFRQMTPEGELMSFEKNKENQHRLGQELQRAGYGFIETVGGYQEKGQGPGTEWSFFVPGKSQEGVPEINNRLKDVLLQEGRRFNQDSIIYRAFNDPRIYDIKCQDGKTYLLGNNLSFERIEKYWTQLRSGTHAAQDIKFKFGYARGRKEVPRK